MNFDISGRAKKIVEFILEKVSFILNQIRSLEEKTLNQPSLMTLSTDDHYCFLRRFVRMRNIIRAESYGATCEYSSVLKEEVSMKLCSATSIQLSE